ncbi:hypothetical protein OH76DRAFT_1528365 [Lentinus brumalis]|uniref:Uncharacterized protein n=1 Tax=Lentinus brumalis TaxID=2498619 RepID=A0A371CGQ2_9APHY|nr:hypothetical protein OH76DRAFT_1528365 [Polyporus brumalis]
MCTASSFLHIAPGSSRIDSRCVCCSLSTQFQISPAAKSTLPSKSRSSRRSPASRGGTNCGLVSSPFTMRKGTKGAKPGLHIELPLLVIAIGELGKRCGGRRHERRWVTLRGGDDEKMEGFRAKLGEKSTKDRQRGSRAKMRQAEERGTRGGPGDDCRAMDWRVWTSRGSQSAGLITC